MIRPALLTDAEEICRIYNPYILKTTITFEESPVAEEEMRGRIGKITQSFPWLVLEEKGKLLGYAYVSTWRSRSAFRFSVESTIYLDALATGKGHGGKLYDALVQESRVRGIHVIEGCVALPNEASVALHEKMGFKKIAHFSEVGWKFNQWVDVGFWELKL